MFLLLPLLGLLIRAPWADAPAVLTSAGALQALRLSVVTATIATLLTLVLGIPLAWLAGPAGPARGRRCCEHW